MGSPDAIYVKMAGEDGNVGGALWDRELGKRPEPSGSLKRVDDEDRKPRTKEQMEAEAERSGPGKHGGSMRSATTRSRSPERARGQLLEEAMQHTMKGLLPRNRGPESRLWELGVSFISGGPSISASLCVFALGEPGLVVRATIEAHELETAGDSARSTIGVGPWRHWKLHGTMSAAACRSTTGASDLDGRWILDRKRTWLVAGSEGAGVAHRLSLHDESESAQAQVASRTLQRHQHAWSNLCFSAIVGRFRFSGAWLSGSSLHFFALRDQHQLTSATKINPPPVPWLDRVKSDI
ncbi:hypothetical protein NM208_g14382 [Fusarium decemcellulare]|uniref:Uncharacterized protein n=1 Tax=Fusarium decemcellulare TaxID=57161 RepID=A0ACC1RI28_9HYPO|nr:hypothetical protein NM208_g14382 [Fusarium decemcellulare]